MIVQDAHWMREPSWGAKRAWSSVLVCSSNWVPQLRAALKEKRISLICTKLGYDLALIWGLESLTKPRLERHLIFILLGGRPGSFGDWGRWCWEAQSGILEDQSLVWPKVKATRLLGFPFPLILTLHANIWRELEWKYSGSRAHFPC